MFKRVEKSKIRVEDIMDFERVAEEEHEDCELEIVEESIEFEDEIVEDLEEKEKREIVKAMLNIYLPDFY